MIPLSEFEIHAPPVWDGRTESTYLIIIHKGCGASLGECDMLDLETAVDLAVDHKCEGLHAVLHIGRFYSRCSACGGNADLYESHHVMTRMQGEGCGAKFVSTASDYGDEAGCKRLRPDLPYVG